jgi:hypothetical protein
LAESRICTVIYDQGFSPDTVLREAVTALQGRGLGVGGLLQTGRSGNAVDCGELALEDIGSGRRIQAFERRGQGTRGCKLDTSSLAEAGGWLRAAIDRKPDILFINRFGRQEAGGRGLTDEIAAAVTAEIPLVIAVGRMLLPEWLAFAGDDVVRTEVDARLIEMWCLERTGVAVSS